MAVGCQTIKPNINRVCSSDFNRRIKIQTTSIAANNSPNASSTTAFATVATVWAMVKTTPISKFIDGVNVESGITTDFFIRFSSAINFEVELWVEYNNNRFRIDGVENIDKQNKIVRLRSIERGSKNIQANQR